MNNFFGFTADGTGRTSPRRRRALGLSIGLLYLIELVGQIAGYSGVKLVLGALALVLFVAVYLTAGLLRESWADPLGRPGWAVYAVFAALAAGLPFAFGADWSGLPIYVAVLSAVMLPRGWAFPAVVGASAVAGGQAWLLGVRSGGVLTITITAFTIGMMMLAFRHSRMLVQQLQEARGEVARLAANEERLRIARDLHDLLGHSLSLIVLKSELAGRMAERDLAKTTQEIKDIESVARQALADVREAVSGYRQRDLTDELDSARAVLHAAGVDAIVRLPGAQTGGSPLPDVVDGLFGWAVREGVTNVVRHARASRCEIEVSRKGPAAVLRIDDDGTGAQPSPRVHGMGGTGDGGTGNGDTGDGTGGALSGGALRGGTGGNGLLGLRERIEAAGGSVEVGPRPAGGFRLIVRVPVSVPPSVPVPASVPVAVPVAAPDPVPSPGPKPAPGSDPAPVPAPRDRTAPTGETA